MNTSPRGSSLVSVITVVLNRAQELERNLRSVAGQDYPCCEHIVIDGGSTDGTVELLREYDGKLAYWHSEPDAGIADAMNKGVAAARGDWILFLGVDDRFAASTSLSEMLHLAAGCDADIVAGLVLLERANGQPERLDPRGLNFRANFKTPLLHQGTLCRRALFARIGGFDESLRIAMDYDFFLRAYRAGEHACLVHCVSAIMGGDGIGSRDDWATLRHRFGEEQRVRLRHCQSAWLRLSFRLMHACYLGYRLCLRAW